MRTPALMQGRPLLCLAGGRHTRILLYHAQRQSSVRGRCCWLLVQPSIAVTAGSAPQSVLMPLSNANCKPTAHLFIWFHHFERFALFDPTHAAKCIHHLPTCLLSWLAILFCLQSGGLPLQQVLPTCLLSVQALFIQ